jgi:uncharacterized protein (DUF736 family)
MKVEQVRFKHQDRGANYAIVTEDGAELGAAWLKTGEYGDFLSVKLDCPTLAAGPINASMSLSPTAEGLFLLRWQRREQLRRNGDAKHGGGSDGSV